MNYFNYFTCLSFIFLIIKISFLFIILINFMLYLFFSKYLLFIAILDNDSHIHSVVKTNLGNFIYISKNLDLNHCRIKRKQKQSEKLRDSH